MNCINFAYFDFSPRFLVEEGGGWWVMKGTLLTIEVDF